MAKFMAWQTIIENAIDFERKAEPPITEMFPGLLEEVAELSRALFDVHEHVPAYELIQIGGIVVNMLSKYSDTEIREAQKEIHKKHGLDKIA